MPSATPGMSIPQTSAHHAPITGPGVWVRSDFEDASRWRHCLSPQVLRELDQSLESIHASGKDLASVSPADFSLPSFAAQAAELRRELMSGRGFVLLQGFPVGRYSEQDSALLYWGLGAALGVPLPQNVKGDRLYSVRDEGYNIERDYGAVGVRFSKTTEGLQFHTDSAPALMGDTPDVIGLLALQVARSGGESALVSAAAVHNVLLRERPGVLERLYRPYYFDRHAELRPGEPATLFAPVFTYDGRLRVRYFRFYIPKGHDFAGDPLSPSDVEALDALEEVMSREEMQVRFSMDRGDIQLISNTFVLHSRTAFEDHPDPARRRHLLRLWLKLG